MGQLGETGPTPGVDSEVMADGARIWYIGRLWDSPIDTERNRAAGAAAHMYGEDWPKSPPLSETRPIGRP